MPQNAFRLVQTGKGVVHCFMFCVSDNMVSYMCLPLWHVGPFQRRLRKSASDLIRKLAKGWKNT